MEKEDKIETEEDKHSFKDKIMKVLTDSDYLNKRSSKLSVDDFLRLLLVFNQNDIHFR